MRQAWRVIAGLLAVGALATGGSVALADDGGGHGGNGNQGDNGAAALAPTIFTLDEPAPADGNPEGVAFDKRSGAFFVSRTGTGAIYRGTLGEAAVHPFIAGTPGQAGVFKATGLKVRDGLLYVAGAATGTVKVYDIANPAKAPIVFDTTGGDTSATFVNDLDVTEDGDVFATDSKRPAIYRIDAAAVKAGVNGQAQKLDVSSKITVDPAAFNLNGIIAKDNGDELIVVQTNVSKLFRITLDTPGDRNDDNGADDRHAAKASAAQAAAPAVDGIEEITLEGGTLKGGDGLLVDRGRLLVVQGAPTNAIAVVKLRHHGTVGRVEAPVTSTALAGPSTIARAGNLLLVVNANFGGAPPFTVVGLPRNGVRHGGGGGHGGDGGHGGHGGHGPG